MNEQDASRGRKYQATSQVEKRMNMKRLYPPCAVNAETTKYACIADVQEKEKMVWVLSAEFEFGEDSSKSLCRLKLGNCNPKYSGTGRPAL